MPSVVSRRLLVVSNIPTPYRHHFFEVLGEELRRRGGDLYVLFAAHQEPGRHWDPPIGGQFYEARVLPGLTVHPFGTHTHLNPAASRSVTQYNPSWVLTAGSWHAPSTLAVLARSRRSGVPCLFWSEGHHDAVLHPRGWVPALRHQAYRRFDGFAVPNERSGRFALFNARRNVPVLRLPNVVDDDFWGASPPGDKARARAKAGLDEVRTVVTVAALEPRKRVIQTIEAFLSLTDEEQARLQLLIAGAGSQDAEAAALAAGHQHIRLLGQLGQGEVRNLYWASDAFLLASSYDPNPLSMIEAAFAGCVLMATRSVGNSDELVEPATPFAIDDQRADVVEGIAAALRAVADAPAGRMAQLQQRQADRVHRGWRSRAVAARFADDLEGHFPAPDHFLDSR